MFPDVVACASLLVCAGDVVDRYIEKLQSSIDFERS